MAFTSWLQKFMPAALKSSNPLSLTRTPRLPPNDPSLRCPCHSYAATTQSTLCEACNIFISQCHWIQVFGLPSSHFGKVSQRRLKRGSHLWDGDASRSLNWDYEVKARKITRGCHLCELFDSVCVDGDIKYFGEEEVAMTISVRFDYKHGTGDEARISLRIGKEGPAGDVSLRMYHEWAEGHDEEFHPDIPEIMRKPTKDTIPGRFAQMGQCTASNANIGLAQKWLKTCLNDHQLCAQLKAEKVGHPLRLVAVGSNTTEPFLYETESENEVPDYLTLSHCWGTKTMPLRLESGNLESFKKAVPLYSLSKTFQDAILLVRRLGYRFIWIDTLCIIQDSKRDWLLESEFMGNIYRNSICTLAATASTGGDGGLFRIRNTMRNERCQVWGDNTHGIYVGFEKITPLTRYKQDVGRGPLNTRGWVLQERYLSPRVLHFSSNAVYWDCRAQHLCDYSYEIPEENFSSTSFDEGFARPFQLNTKDPLIDFSQRWQFSVERYCRMDLTHESDRLTAFRGVTKYYEEQTGLQYVSGLWKEYFAAHLLWRVPCASLRIASTESEIPSWCWAVVEKPIQYTPPNVNKISIGFWHPQNVGGWPAAPAVKADDPDAVKKLVAEISRHMDLGVDPENGYSSAKVDCITYHADFSSPTLAVVSGSLREATGTVMLVEDVFTKAQESTILAAIEMKGSTPDAHQMLICQWPDSSTFEPENVIYLRVQLEGAHRPKRQRFLSSLFYTNESSINGDDETLLAPYILYVSGIMLEKTRTSNIYKRTGYFRAIEAFGKAPDPHPVGVDSGDLAFKNGWFGVGHDQQLLTII